jgi:hypothetical protein
VTPKISPSPQPEVKPPVQFAAEVRSCQVTQFFAPNRGYLASIEEDAAKLVGKLCVLTRLLHLKGVQKQRSANSFALRIVQ